MSADLLAEIERFLSRTGSPAAQVGRKAVGDPGAVAGLRAGRTARPATAAKWRKWMADNPQGVPAIHSTHRARKTRAEYREENYQQPYPEGKEPNREPCTRCGIRGELGCAHRDALKPPPWFGRYVNLR